MDHTNHAWDLMTGARIITIERTSPLTAVATNKNKRSIQELYNNKLTNRSQLMKGLFSNIQSNKQNATHKLFDAFDRLDSNFNFISQFPLNIYKKAYDFSQCGKQQILGNSDGSINIIDLKYNQIIKTLTGHTGSVTSLKFSKDSKQIVSGSTDCTAKLQNIARQPMFARMQIIKHNAPITTVDQSPCGSQVVTGSSDGVVKVWSTFSGILFFSFSHNDSVTSLSTNSKQILTGSMDGTAMLWDFKTKAKLGVFNHNVYSVDDNRKSVQESGLDSEEVINPIYTVTLSQNTEDRFLVTAGANHKIQLWDIQTGKLMRTFVGHNDKIKSTLITHSEIK